MNDSEPSLRIHLGCWKRHLPGFVHVDLCDFPHIDYRHDIGSLPMFADGSAELVYASHCLEYFDREQAREVLREWGRVLRPGGILRVAVPDFPALVKVYEATGDIQRILGPLYGRMEIQEGEGRPRCLYHKTVYDFRSLEQVLLECGYFNVSRYDWRQTLHKDFDDHSQAYFPHMDKDHGMLVSLNVEATKP